MSEHTPEKDRRRHERKAFVEQEGSIEFLVQVGNEFCAIQSVYDVSISGIRMVIERKLAVGATLVLSAKEPGFCITVKGVVRWSAEEAEDQGYSCGVEFYNEEMNNNVLFFMSLRKYLDQFDDAPFKES